MLRIANTEYRQQSPVRLGFFILISISIFLMVTANFYSNFQSNIFRCLKRQELLQMAKQCLTDVTIRLQSICSGLIH